MVRWEVLELSNSVICCCCCFLFVLIDKMSVNNENYWHPRSRQEHYGAKMYPCFYRVLD